MKFTNVLKPIIALCLLFSMQVFAQDYNSPSRELVETLLEELENCKTYLTQGENLIKTMEANPESYSLAE